jgi:hypothetical protein
MTSFALEDRVTELEATVLRVTKELCQVKRIQKVNAWLILGALVVWGLLGCSGLSQYRRNSWPVGSHYYKLYHDWEPSERK